MSRDVGRFLVAGGVLLAIVGVLAWSGALSWFGRLPGDVRVERTHTRVYAPFASMLVLSLVLSALTWLFRR